MAVIESVITEAAGNKHQRMRLCNSPAESSSPVFITKPRFQRPAIHMDEHTRSAKVYKYSC